MQGLFLNLSCRLENITINPVTNATIKSGPEANNMTHIARSAIAMTIRLT